MAKLSLANASDVFYVYGFRDVRTRKWRYIGQSVEPRKRQYRHVNGALRSTRLEFSILRRTTMRDVNRIEIQIVRALRRRGEADLNKAVRDGRAVKGPTSGKVILWKERGMQLENLSRAARYFDVSTTSISKAVKGDGILCEGVTLVPDVEAWQRAGIPLPTRFSNE